MGAVGRESSSRRCTRQAAAYIVMRRAQLPLAARGPAMAEYFSLHPIDPQLRLIRRAAELLRAGALIAYPTDSCYALGWHLGDKSALERVLRIRQADRHHHFTLVCANLTDVGRFARLETWQFRLLRAWLPGAYTFLLRAPRETPRRLQHARRRTTSCRSPDHPGPGVLLAWLRDPIRSGARPV